MCRPARALLLACLLLPPLAPAAASKKRVAAVANDISRRLAKWRFVEMSFDSAALSPRERRMVEKLVEACRSLDAIFWRQSDPEGLTLYQSLAGSKNPHDQTLRRLLLANGSRFDLLDDNKPFVGATPMRPGHALYPPGWTRARIEQYVQQHPQQKEEIYSPYTVVRERQSRLEAIPYHVAFQSWLDPAAQALREAAALSDDPAFARFLRLRADALLTDNFYPSDLAWLGLKDPKFDVIFAPYETYLDDLLGIKTSYGAAVLIRNSAESAKLAVFQKYVPDIQDALPLAPADRPSKRGHATPMEVADAPFRSGDLLHGYQAVADNLPNDPRIHREKGTKKIFFKNFMDARVNDVILPVAQRLMRPDQAARVSPEDYLAWVMLHEISHGLGPAYARTPSGQVDINAAIGPLYSALEESKADVVGLFGVKWLIERGALPQSHREGYYASYFAGMLRSVRFGAGEAHARGLLVQFNCLSEQKAIARDAASGRYVIDYSRMPAALDQLAKELLEIEAAGDRTRVESWFRRYDTLPPDLAYSLAALADIPVDIFPIFSFSEDPL